MSAPSYYSRYFAEGFSETREGVGVIQATLNFLRSLNRHEWVELLGDILKQSQRAAMVLHPSRGISMDERLAYLLDEVDPETRRMAFTSIASAVEEEVASLDGRHVEPNAPDLSRLLTLLSPGLPPETRPWIERLMDVSKYPAWVSVAAARCLVDNEDVPLTVWERYAKSSNGELAACALTAVAFRDVDRFWPTLFSMREGIVTLKLIEQALIHSLTLSYERTSDKEKLRRLLLTAPKHIMGFIEAIGEHLGSQHVIPWEPLGTLDSQSNELEVAELAEAGKVVLPLDRDDGDPFRVTGELPGYFIGHVRDARFISGGTESFQEEIVNIVAARVGIVGQGNLEQRDFASLLEEGSFSHDGYLLTFAYFHFGELRENRWGVIPYGWQRSIGIILSRSNPILRNLLKERGFGQLDRYTDPEPVLSLESWKGGEEAIAWKFLGDAIDAALRESQAAYESGFIFGDVAQECLLKLGQIDRRRSFKGSALRVAPDLRTSQYWWAYPGTRPKGKATHSLFLIDPAELPACSIGADYCAVVLPHFLRIAVGIGFNWPMARIFEASKAWRSVREKVLELVSQENVKKDLLRSGKSGIELVLSDSNERPRQARTGGSPGNLLQYPSKDSPR
jgi:hypothetical protein